MSPTLVYVFVLDPLDHSGPFAMSSVVTGGVRNTKGHVYHHMTQRRR